MPWVKSEMCTGCGDCIFDAALAHDHVMGRSHPDLPRSYIRILVGNIEIRVFHVADRLDDLLGKNSGYPGIQGMTQVRYVNPAFQVRG